MQVHTYFSRVLGWGGVEIGLSFFIFYSILSFSSEQNNNCIILGSKNSQKQF